MRLDVREHRLDLVVVLVEDDARLSPLKHRNLNLLGRYSFRASTSAAGILRPLRDPDAPELAEDDDGHED